MGAGKNNENRLKQMPVSVYQPAVYERI